MAWLCAKIYEIAKRNIKGMWVWGGREPIAFPPCWIQINLHFIVLIPIRFINCQWFLCICQKMYPVLLWEVIYTVLSLLMLTLAECLLFCAKMLGELLWGPERPFLEANCSFKASTAASPPCPWPLDSLWNLKTNLTDLCLRDFIGSDTKSGGLGALFFPWSFRSPLACLAWFRLTVTHSSPNPWLIQLICFLM